MGDDRKQLECRVVITHEPLGMFSLGMYDPLNTKYAPLGRHPKKDIAKIVRDLKHRMERERHLVTFSEITGPR